MSDRFVKIVSDGKTYAVNVDRVLALSKMGDDEYYIHMDNFLSSRTPVIVLKINHADAMRIAPCFSKGATFSG